MNKFIKLIKRWLGIYSFKEGSNFKNYFVEGFEEGFRRNNIGKIINK